MGFHQSSMKSDSVTKSTNSLTYMVSLNSWRNKQRAGTSFCYATRKRTLFAIAISFRTSSMSVTATEFRNSKYYDYARI